MSLYACNNVGSNTNLNNSCPVSAPMFTKELGIQLINNWGDKLYYYSPYGDSDYTDVYVGAAYFTAVSYTVDAVLLPTVNSIIRDTPQSIYNYFTSFLAKGPMMTSVFESGLPFITYANCGIGVISGYYNFTYANGYAETNARYTFQFVYEPIPHNITITVESGSQAGQSLEIYQPEGWYIMSQHSSVLPSTQGISPDLIIK